MVTLMPIETRAALACVVGLLCLIQIPRDIRTRTLSRRATMFGALALAAVVLTDAVQRGVFRDTLSVVAIVSAVFGVYYMLHAISPRALGFGDVLLVVPLTMAVSYVEISQTLTWQIAATTSAAVHGLIGRIRTRSTSIAFGPHLLTWALLFVVFGT